MRRRYTPVVGCVVVTVVVGLAGCRETSVAEGERAVRAYCDAVILAYRTSDITLLRPLTTDKELRKIVALIEIKTAAGLVLESTLEELEATGVDRPSPGVMKVTTTERWRYFDRPLELGRSPGTELVVEMDLEYTFVQGDGVWRMDQARTLRHDYLKPAGHSPRQDVPDGATHGDSP